MDDKADILPLGTAHRSERTSLLCVCVASQPTLCCEGSLPLRLRMPGAVLSDREAQRCLTAVQMQQDVAAVFLREVRRATKANEPTAGALAKELSSIHLFGPARMKAGAGPTRAALPRRGLVAHPIRLTVAQAPHRGRGDVAGVQRSR